MYHGSVLSQFTEFDPGCVLLQSELEETLHKLELENTRLDSALSHETEKVEQLQKELSDSGQVKYIGLQ